MAVFLREVANDELILLFVNAKLLLFKNCSVLLDFNTENQQKTL